MGVRSRIDPTALSYRKQLHVRHQARPRFTAAKPSVGVRATLALKAPHPVGSYRPTGVSGSR